MSGFKDFIMRGNLVEIAVAFIMATAFAAVVTAFTTMILDIIGKAGGSPNFSGWQPGGIHVGSFITAVIAFLILAAVVYFFVVKPYEMAKARWTKEPEVAETELELLAQIRDSLAVRR
ncbi:MAG TPA: MscL family protein [Segeticoccus sp.]|uniref:MscL family protein n=1 Tax=Segeticoccus sp. TaxID=2706531 RepID=UPI002D80B17E|nr:MscL family protein [Segeticoccus sp.]HET8600054.1 MscL family protein [Segeticoccus sp.]